MLIRRSVSSTGQLDRRSRPRLAARNVGAAHGRQRHRSGDLDRHGCAAASEPRRPQRRLLPGLGDSDHIAVLKQEGRFCAISAPDRFLTRLPHYSSRFPEPTYAIFRPAPKSHFMLLTSEPHHGAATRRREVTS